MIIDLVAMPAVTLLHPGRATELEHGRRHELVEGRWHATHLNLVDGIRIPSMADRGAGWFTFASDMTAGISHASFTEYVFDRLRVALAAVSGHTTDTLPPGAAFHDLATCPPTRCVFLRAAVARTVASFDQRCVTGDLAAEAARVARVFRHASRTSGLVEVFAAGPASAHRREPQSVLDETAALGFGSTSPRNEFGCDPLAGVAGGRTPRMS